MHAMTSGPAGRADATGPGAPSPSQSQSSSSAAASGRGRPGVVACLRAQWRRLVRWPAVWVLLGAWQVTAVTFGYVFPYVSYLSGDEGFSTRGTTTDLLLADLLPANVPGVLLQGMPLFGGALMLVLGAVTAGNGYGWGTWKTAFTQGPSRAAVISGSTAAVIALVVLAVLTTVVLDLAAALTVGALESADLTAPDRSELARAVGGGLVVMAMWALIGYALGTVTRNPALSVGLGLVWTLVLENLLRGVGGSLSGVQAVTEVMPGTAAGSLVGALAPASPSGDSTPGVLTTLDGGQALATAACYLLLAAGLSVVLARRRDVT